MSKKKSNPRPKEVGAIKPPPPPAPPKKEANEYDTKKQLKKIIDEGINLQCEFWREVRETTWDISIGDPTPLFRTYKPGQAHFKIWGDTK